MSTLRDLKEYRFATQAQWETGLFAKIRLRGDGPVRLERPLAPSPRFVASRGDAKTHAPAFDAHGTLHWRTDNGFLQWLGKDGAAAIEAAQVAVNSPRLVIGRTWLWTFRHNTPCVTRFDFPTIQEDGTIRLEGGWVIRDMATDGADGVWLLLSRGATRYALRRIDATGHVGRVRELPQQFGRPREIAYLQATRRLALLNAEGTGLAFVDPCEPRWTNWVSLAAEIHGFCARSLSSDGRDRLLAVGTAEGGSPTVLLLDTSGGLLDRVAKGLDGYLPITGAAARGAEVALATAKGILLFEAKPAGDAQEAEGVFLTPALYSPEAYALRGWLRAEFWAVLPKGASLEVAAMSTDDPTIRDEVTAIFQNAALSHGQRQAEIAKLEGLTRSGPFHFVSPEDDPGYRQLPPSQAASNAPSCLAVPLFDHRRLDRWNPWLWLEVRLAAAPDSGLPELHGLRVLYPEVSLAQHVPAIFRGDVTARDPKSGDPTGFFRQLLGLLETTTQGIDQTVSTLGRRIHPATAEGEWLDFVARWLDLPWDDALPEPLKHRILANAAGLLAQRGTRSGLELLLSSLFPKRKARVADFNVDYGLATLGGTTAAGNACQGSTLPAVLSGLPASAAALSRQAVLGRARLGHDGDGGDPTGASRFMGLLGIDIMASAGERSAVEPVLPGLLAAMTPAGLRTAIRWRSAASHGLAPRLDESFVLDDPGHRRLGQDAHLGLTILAGGRYRQLAESGIGLGFRIQ